MIDRRGKNVNWTPLDEKGNAPTWERAALAVFMDIRDELQDLNRLLHCHGFQRIPYHLDQIRKHTAKRKRKPKVEQP
jgi:hypothetical protein